MKQMGIRLDTIKVFTTNSKYNEYYERVDGSTGKQIKNLEIINLF